MSVDYRSYIICQFMASWTSRFIFLICTLFTYCFSYICFVPFVEIVRVSMNFTHTMQLTGDLMIKYKGSPCGKGSLGSQAWLADFWHKSTIPVAEAASAVRRPVLMLLLMLRRRSRRGLASGVGHSLEAPRQLQHLRAEGVKGGHSRGWRFAFREPKLVGVEGSQLGVGRRAGSVLRGAAAPAGAFVEEKPLPGASPFETCELSGSTESFSVLSRFKRFVNLIIFPSPLSLSLSIFF